MFFILHKTGYGRASSSHILDRSEQILIVMEGM